MDDEAVNYWEDNSCLESLSKEELIKRVARLNSSNNILRRQIHNLKRDLSKNDYRKPNQRKFNFESHNQVKVAFKVAYLGWKYQGFASQDNTSNTIEHELFAALNKTCLIEDRGKCGYSRCGRTDKGVSAFGQLGPDDSESFPAVCCANKVISLKVRGESNNDKDVSLNYAKILNRVLPSDIKILAFAHVPESFDARFSCISRTYKYFFPVATLDIEVMKVAAEKLIGEHDFRNFCKVDVGNNVNHFMRNIQDIHIGPMLNDSISDNGCKIYEITIRGMAFLWHQVRCMVSVLFLIGLRLEGPEVIERMLDISCCPKKPQYSMVSEIPLTLYDCCFESINWHLVPDQLAFTTEHFQGIWTDLAVRKAMMSRVLDDCRLFGGSTSLHYESYLSPLMPGHRRKNYRPLLTRPVCDGIERHLNKQVVKRKQLQDRKTGFKQSKQS